MRIAIFPNLDKAQALPLAVGIREYLEAKGVHLYAEEEVASVIQAKNLNDVKPLDIDFRITLGGDGTIIRMLHRHPEIEAPVLGINHGSLGFMADTPVSDIYKSLDALLSGNFTLENRQMIEGKSSSGVSGFALNEIVIHRSENPSLIEILVNVDGKYLNTFSADGIILSTANGSTAYSLAAGGPILTPELKSIVLTPICPHTISNRPIVLVPQKIEVKYLSSPKPAELAFDGFNRYPVFKDETIQIFPSTKYFQLVLLKNHDYFSTLRSKLGWSGKLKS